VALTTALLLSAVGPTAAWRHTPIGAGRADLSVKSTNELREWLAERRRWTVWEADGLESSVGIQGMDGLSFIVNGKSDGNSIGDGGTQVMGGLIGALVHPQPRSALVIGLGTGSTAGWLGSVPEMERVDAVEIEPAILEVARQCADINERVLDNPKVRIHIDARSCSHPRTPTTSSSPSPPTPTGPASPASSPASSTRR
jgi:hypothetical protein